jgi:crotonobetainyl-CoA:carnitine CoA-transferase CaiB-like acyl-CoA transferase
VAADQSDARLSHFSGFFHVIYRGKRSVAVDLGNDEGRLIAAAAD